MLTARSIVEFLEKEKYVAYFILLWAGTYFFYNLSNLIYDATHFNNALKGVALIGDLLDVLAGVFLGILGFKLLSANVLATLTKEKALVYFLFFWAGAFCIWGIYDIANYHPASVDGVFWDLGGLCGLAGGVVLGINRP